jgi:hypothetical protein
MNPADITHAFAEPGSSHIIDGINPTTQRSMIAGETLDELRLRYPAAERINLQEWMDAKAARQDAPVTWDPITQEQYDEWMNCLPPAHWQPGAFMVGEPSDHHAGTGLPRFQACIARNNAHYASSRPMTLPEFKKFLTNPTP